jgi:hypothetical protein
MPQKITVSTSISGFGVAAKQKVGSYSPDQIAALDETINPSVTNQQINFDFKKATLLVVYMIPAGGDLTIKTNSSGSPQETIVLKDGIGIYWAVNEGHACPFAGDVTAIYVTNATLNQVKLNCGAGYGDTL